MLPFHFIQVSSLIPPNPGGAQSHAIGQPGGRYLPFPSHLFLLMFTQVPYSSRYLPFPPGLPEIIATLPPIEPYPRSLIPQLHCIWLLSFINWPRFARYLDIGLLWFPPPPSLAIRPHQDESGPQAYAAAKGGYGGTLFFPRQSSTSDAKSHPPPHCTKVHPTASLVRRACSSRPPVTELYPYGTYHRLSDFHSFPDPTRETLQPPPPVSRLEMRIDDDDDLAATDR